MNIGDRVKTVDTEFPQFYGQIVDIPDPDVALVTFDDGNTVQVETARLELIA